ncbi:conserved hypothetical protein [Corynebacterium striatum]|nr:conserved hypothetical protein [Corynebacterium striatum]
MQHQQYRFISVALGRIALANMPVKATFWVGYPNFTQDIHHCIPSLGQPRHNQATLDDAALA